MAGVEFKATTGGITSCPSRGLAARHPGLVVTAGVPFVTKLH